MTLIGLDLDDTLYLERHYVASGHRAVIEAFVGETGFAPTDSPALFDEIVALGIPGWDIRRILHIYRTHVPILQPDYELIELLNQLRARGHKVVIITDGQTTRQEAKIDALGLRGAVDGIFISEGVGGDKTVGAGFMAAERLFPCASRIYIGDNPAKDFYWANMHGWQTAMIVDSGRGHVHPQIAPTALHRARTAIFDLKTFLKSM